MSMTIEEFRLGLTSEQYIEQMRTNQDAFRKILDSVVTPLEEQTFFSTLSKPLHVAVFTEDWCGDSLTCTPALFKLAIDTNNLEIRVFLRDHNTELAHNYLPEHRWGTVPVFVFFDQGMREICRFIETAPEMAPIMDALWQELLQEIQPNVDENSDISAEPEGFGDRFKEMFSEKRTAARVTHAQEWGQIVITSIGQVVHYGLGTNLTQRPVYGGTTFP